MIIAVAQLNITIGDFENTYLKIKEAVQIAKSELADLIVFSELTTTGYPPRDLLNNPDFVECNNQLIKKVAALSTEKLGILFGHVERNLFLSGRKLKNAASLAVGGEVVSTIYKTLLPTYDVFDEDRYFEASDKTELHCISFRGLKLGVSICEDLWNDASVWNDRLYRRDPIAELANRGADILINLSASPFIIGKPNVRRGLVKHAATKYNIPVVYVNQVGGNDELVFDGGSMVASRHAEIIAQAKFCAEDFLLVNIHDTQLTGIIQETSDIKQAHSALVLGIRDYVYKCGFKDVVIGLSGGIDSAVTATLAVSALGKENVVGISMPSEFSSEDSYNDAKVLATNLGIRFEIIPIKSVYDSFVTTLSDVFINTHFDVTEENLQARIRGSILMAYSNKFGHLVLTTGNKSEIAVGYCTLYGDMCGGLSVLSDVPKTMVYELADFVNINIPVIPTNTIKKAPSAELRPEQLDSDSLPPYPVLDSIIYQYVDELYPVHKIKLSEGLMNMYPQEDFGKLIEKICKMIDKAEYKRRQAAPGLKITSKAFGIGRRVPVAHRFK